MCGGVSAQEADSVHSIHVLKSRIKLFTKYEHFNSNLDHLVLLVTRS